MLKITFKTYFISVAIANYNGDDPKQQKLSIMLEKANFKPSAIGVWERHDELKKWYDHCEILAQKVGGEIIDQREEGETASSTLETESENPPSLLPSTLPLEKRIAELEAEVKRLGEQDAIASKEFSDLERKLQELLS